MRIEIIEEIGPLEQRSWRFYVSAELGTGGFVQVSLSNVLEESRPTTRHKWRREKFYEENRQNAGWPGEVPAKIVGQALFAVHERIVFKPSK